ncbi:GntR family transcriptional regulator [Citricoccus sp. GCM10030269]|uniref:GntR family transcriptional regulator n=1 Tax=Citricoccus sp. GCM10030269 TaxID=3273388 RepID=UPI00360C4C60
MTLSSDAGFLAPLPPPDTVPTRTEMIVESLKEAIFSGRLKPGEVLVERKIAEQLGVSKTPVREALIVLQRSGLLSVGQRSIAVRTLSFTEIRHVYEERVLLEPWAIIDAARVNPDFSAARAALDEARQHAAAGDTVARALANRRFHRGMYANSENTIIVKSLDSLQDLTALAVVGVLWEHWPQWGIEGTEHEAILEAAQSGDPERAAELMRRHITTSIERAAASERSGS